MIFSKYNIELYNFVLGQQTQKHFGQRASDHRDRRLINKFGIFEL